MNSDYQKKNKQTENSERTITMVVVFFIISPFLVLLGLLLFKFVNAEGNTNNFAYINMNVVC